MTACKLVARPLDPTAPPKTIYRHLLRAAAAHPDDHVAQYFKAHWRARSKKLLGKDDGPEVQNRLDRARKALRRLQRASNCIPEDFDWSLRQGYGLAGKARHHLADPFISSKVLRVAKPIEAGNPHSIPPAYSPMLVALLNSKVIRDTPVPAPMLSLPPTLPPAGRPKSSELYIRPFMMPDREAHARWRYWRELLTDTEGGWPRMRYPLVVRLLNHDSNAVAAEDPTPKLRALGVDWSAFADGRRERVLDWLEAKAGKGLPMTFRPPVRPPVTRESIEQLAAATPSTTPSPAPAPAQAADRFEPPLAGHPAQPSAAFPKNHHLYYRRLLSHLPIVSIDMSKLDLPYKWYKPSLSHWSEKGPGLFRPPSADDEGYLDTRRGFKR